MNSIPKISIIVVSLNTKNKLLKTINSVKKQSFLNFELLVIDGKSVDGSIDLIKKNNKIIKKYIIEKDRGIYDAMNKGIKISTGRWILFLNSGDIFFNNSVLSKISKFLKNSIDILYGSTVINNGFFYFSRPKKISMREFQIPFCHQSVICRSSLLKKNLFNLNYKICSDFDFIMSCIIKKKKFKVYPNFISTVEAGGLSDTMRYKTYIENLKITLKYNNFKNVFFRFSISFILMCLISILKRLLPNYLINKILYYKYKSKII